MSTLNFKPTNQKEFNNLVDSVCKRSSQEFNPITQKEFNNLVDSVCNIVKNQTYFCECCNKTIKAINKDEHEKSKMHLKYLNKGGKIKK